MKNRETSEMVRCYSECYDFFKAAGFTARLLRLDNEVSRTLIKRIEEVELDYQLAALGDHRQTQQNAPFKTTKITSFQY